MQNKRYWLRGGLTYIIQNMATVLIGFLSFFFLVRILDSKDEFGAWSLFLSVVGILEITRNGFTHEALVKFLASARSEDEKRDIITVTFVVNFITTLVLILITLAIGPYLGKIWNVPEMSMVLNLYIVGLILTGFINQFNCIEQANFRVKGIFYSNIIKQLSFFCYILYCFLFDHKTNIVYLTYMQLVSIAIAFIISYYYAREFIVYNRIIDRKWLKKVFDFGKYTFGVSVSSVLVTSIDQMMLGSMLNAAATGAFNIVVRITNLASIPTNAIAAIVYPQSSRRADSEGPQALKYLYEKSVGVVLSILVPCITVLWIFADFIVPLIASQEYIETVPILRITLLTCLFFPYGSQCGIILTSAGKTKFNFYLLIINFVTIIVLNFFFIKAFGIMGAAYASLISTLIGILIGQLYLRKIYKINFFSPWIYGYRFYGEFLNNYILKKTNKE